MALSSMCGSLSVHGMLIMGGSLIDPVRSACLAHSSHGVRSHSTVPSHHGSLVRLGTLSTAARSITPILSLTMARSNYKGLSAGLARSQTTVLAYIAARSAAMVLTSNLAHSHRTALSDWKARSLKSGCSSGTASFVHFGTHMADDSLRQHGALYANGSLP